MQKQDVIAALREMADLLEIADANAFEVMAYRNGSQALEDWYGDLDQAVADRTLTEIPAVGKGLSQVISDLVRSGSSPELERVRGLVPPELPRLLRVRGLGPKRVRALWRDLGIESPDDLRRTAGDGQVQSLRGFGAKTVERILAGLDDLQNAPLPAKRKETAGDGLPKAPKAAGRIWAGTSGYSYPQWKGSFYPDDARPADFLEIYAARLSSVEINNTFYRFPAEAVVGQWKAQTPAHFRFSLKAHRRITHQLRLSPAAGEQIADFVARCGQLGSRLGCILFQLPPNFVRDDARLGVLLNALSQGPRYAVEFRHESWFAEDVYEQLRRRNVACVSGDAEDQPPRHLVTADFVYVRLRRESYTETDLDAWDQWFQQQTAEKRDVLAYLKHDEAGATPDIMARWTPLKPAAREILQKTLAEPAKRTTKRRRKTG